MRDFLIVGGGVIGLSLAWELADRGKQVLVVDHAEAETVASWAGAGVLPPPLRLATHDPLEQLRTLSHDLHPSWAERLCEISGINNQLLRCGGIYLARGVAEAVSLRVAMGQSSEEGVVANELTTAELGQLEPSLQDVARDQVIAAFRLPDEMQVRSPRNLRALKTACERCGVDLRQNVQVRSIQVEKNCAVSLVTSSERIQAKNYCLTTGAWTAGLLARLGWNLPIEPWRGQMILWKTDQPIVSQVINEGHRYLVPRSDGHLVVGATVEDVGFDCQTTQEAIDELREFSCELIPALRKQLVVRAWAGLRPKTPDGLPFLGPVPGVENLSVATGHYRSGLHLAPVTAVLMSQLLLGETPVIDLGPFRLNR